MFDFDASKLLIVGIIALVFIPPKDLPRVLRQVGQFVGKMRRMASEFQGQFMDAMREADMADLRKEAQKLADAARIETGLDSVHDLGRQMTSAVEAKPRGDATPAQVSSDHVPPAYDPADPPLGPPPDDKDPFAALQEEMRPLLIGDGETPAAPHNDAGDSRATEPERGKPDHHEHDPPKRILQTVPPDGA